MADTKVMTHVLRRRASTPATSLAENLLDLSVPESVRTQVIELSPAARRHTELLEICARDLPPPDAMLLDTQITKVAPALPAADPNLTIYDGGALREFARQLAEEEERQARAARMRKAYPAWEKGSSDVEAKSSPGRTQLTAPPESFTAFRRLVPPKFGTALLERWSATALSRKLVLALLPIAAATLLLLRGSLAPQPAPSLRASATRPAPASVPSARATSANESGKPAPKPAPTSASASSDPVLEREALRTALAGNKQQAVLAYERLAARPGGERFRVAARLLRENRVRRP